MSPDYWNSKNRTLPVLVVEDNSDHQVLIEHSLQKTIPQAKPVFLATADEATAYLAKHSTDKANFPNVVLLDIYLPRPEIGWQLLKEIRRRYPFLPTLVLSADGHPDTVKAAYDLGAHSFLEKPLTLQDWETLFDTVRDYWMLTVTLPRIL